MEAKNLFEATDGTFEKDVLQSKGTVLVDFWAEWCGPCKMLGPTLHTISNEYEGKLKVYKMDVDANPETPGKFHVHGIPTVILFKDGQPVDQFVGAKSKPAVEEFINKHLA
ncbi:MAG TPA: thioredoxin [bacterium]|nr:thioredoxin [bacterium]